jgi:hypothetical protein
MSGLRRLSREEEHTPSFTRLRWASEWNFGLIAFVLLAALALAAALMMPEIITR